VCHTDTVVTVLYLCRNNSDLITVSLARAVKPVLELSIV